VPDRAHVHVRLGAFEFAFCHFCCSRLKNSSESNDYVLRGAHGADRTRDLPLTKGVLYH
jgi:hypothetical protein